MTAPAPAPRDLLGLAASQDWTPLGRRLMALNLFGGRPPRSGGGLAAGVLLVVMLAAGLLIGGMV